MPRSQEETNKLLESSKNNLDKSGEKREEINKILKTIEPTFEQQQKLFRLGIASIIVVGILHILF